MCRWTVAAQAAAAQPPTEYAGFRGRRRGLEPFQWRLLQCSLPLQLVAQSHRASDGQNPSRSSLHRSGEKEWRREELRRPPRLRAASLLIRILRSSQPRKQHCGDGHHSHNNLPLVSFTCRISRHASEVAQKQ